MKRFLFGIFFLSLATVHANKLTINDTAIHAVSSFEKVDYFSTYSHTGEFLWEVPFSSQIVSWEKNGDLLIIFSKTRDRGAFFLSCVDPATGKVKWEKGVFEPRAAVQMEEPTNN